MDVVTEENVLVGSYEHCEHLTSEDKGTLIKVIVRDETLGSKVYCPTCTQAVLSSH
jgi:hypothetical protein